MVAKPSRRRRIRYSELDGLSRDRLDHFKDDIAAFGIEGVDADSITFETTANEVQGVANTPADGSRVVFVDDGSGLPPEVEAGALYYIAVAVDPNYTLHATLEDAATGANAIDLTGANVTADMYVLPS